MNNNFGPFHKLAEATRTIFWEYDLDKDCWNYIAPQVESILGYTPEEWMKNHFWIDHIYPEDRPQTLETYNNIALNGQGKSFEYRFVKKNGQIIWLLEEINVELVNDKPSILRGFIIDINERKQYELALHEREESLKITLNSIGDAVVATDCSGRITKINPVAEKLTGWREQEACGKRFEDVLVLVNAKTGEPVKNPVQTVIEQDIIVGLANHTLLISKNGTEHQIADSAAPIRDAHGKTVGVVLVFRDVTKEYQMQQALRDSEERFRNIMASMHDVVYTLDCDQRHTGVYGPWVDNTGLL